MRYKVVYDRDKCTGEQECMRLHPRLWGEDARGKAVLKHGAAHPRSGKFELEIGESQLKAYRESALVCPVYAIDILNARSNRSILKLRPSADESRVPLVRASYDSRKEWEMDPRGFFTIKPFPKKRVIRVRYYGPDHALQLVIEGRTAEELYNTIVRRKLVGKLEHAAYLGSELAKAEIALRKKLAYVQDAPLP